jgi:hypothetical protein
MAATTSTGGAGGGAMTVATPARPMEASAMKTARPTCSDAASTEPDCRMAAPTTRRAGLSPADHVRVRVMGFLPRVVGPIERDPKRQVTLRIGRCDADYAGRIIGTPGFAPC